ncbi:MAG: M23 family metallopeptidase, partial [Chitinophagaceae bacterium]
MELFYHDGDAFKPVADSKTGFLNGGGDLSGLYKLIIQPGPGSSATPFFLSLQKKPLFQFPVAGKGNAAIQSFWGQVRDGGARSHEGIDIFAPKGTPVVAVTDGTVTDAGERGIGGKQVWLRTKSGFFGKSIY